jgi:hypothetical protein
MLLLPLRPINPQAPSTTCMHILLYLLQLSRVDTHVLFSGQNLMKRFVALGNECVEYQKIAKASEGKSHFQYLLIFACLTLLLCLTFSFLFVKLRRSKGSQCSHFITGS